VSLKPFSRTAPKQNMTLVAGRCPLRSRLEFVAPQIRDDGSKIMIVRNAETPNGERRHLP